jgi:hypothetical protein
LNTLNPIVEQEFDARRYGAIGSSRAQGHWVALLLSPAGCPVLAFETLAFGKQRDQQEGREPQAGLATLHLTSKSGPGSALELPYMNRPPLMDSSAPVM